MRLSTVHNIPAAILLFALQRELFQLYPSFHRTRKLLVGVRLQLEFSCDGLHAPQILVSMLHTFTRDIVQN